MKKLISLFVISAFLFTLVPVQPVSANGDSVPNYGFIPNSGEASVSKVDLVTGTAVARYWTAPRLGESINFDGTTEGAVANNVPPYAWRTSRIAMDAQGNAWVLNVGADAFLNSYPNDPPTNFSSYRAYNVTNINAYGLVGSVVRIQANTTGLTTNGDHSSPLTFGTDQAVQVFPVGEKGEMPRAIAVDANGDVWIGFYGGKYFQKYTYNGEALTPDGEKITGNFTPYEAKIDKNGILWFSSRFANPKISTTQGIFWFDTKADTPTVNSVSLGVNPYSLLIDNGDEGEDVVIWATALGNYLYKIDTNSTSVTSIFIASGAGLRGLSFDANGLIWMAGSSNNRVYSYNPVGGAIQTSNVIVSGAIPVGVGKDADGMMWVVCRYDGNSAGFIAKFDPANLPGGFTLTYVGYRPYAYGDFVVPTPPTYEICGYKYAEWEGEEIPLSGWEIILEKSGDDPEWDLVATTTTGANGQYCFTDLEEGDYRVSETLKDGWDQVYPVGNVYEITLPYEGDLDSFDFHNAPKKWCGDETAWAAEQHPGETRFVDQGNWATYVGYNKGDGNEKEPKTYPLYAGQYYLAGMLHAWDEDNTLSVKYDIYIPEGILEHCIDEGGKVYGKEGFCGDWIGFLEYHLHVVDEFTDFNEVRTYNRRTKKYGNPIPGQFEYKGSFDSAESESDWIEVDITGFSSDFFIAAHSVMQWCGYDCDALAEIGGWKLLETVEVDSSKMGGASSGNVLEDGKTYKFVASGTWKNGSVHTAVDAECRLPVGATGWELSRPRSLRLQVNEEYVQWGEYCAPDNIYTIYFDGQDEKVKFRIVDGMPPVPGWYGDNSGSIWVTIFAWE